MAVFEDEGRGIVDLGREGLVNRPCGCGVSFSPTPLVRLACGSMSTRSTRCSAKASEAARLMAVVVFPTPAF